MSKGFDASVGLAFSLAAFERYRKNGLLRAELQHVPGIRGKCTGVVHLIEGKVVECYVEEKGGHHVSISKELLIRVDNERGPFSWTLLPLPETPRPEMPRPSVHVSGGPHPGSHPGPHPGPHPQIIAPLDLARVSGWTDQQKYVLKVIFDAIDGQKTIEQIQAQLPLVAPSTIEDGLRILVAFNVVQIID